MLNFSELHPELRYDGSYKTNEELRKDFYRSNHQGVTKSTESSKKKEKQQKKK